MNVMGMVQQMMSNSQVMSNPMIKNAMSMAQSGNSKGIEQMADLPLKAVEHVGDMRNHLIIICR